MILLFALQFFFDPDLEYGDAGKEILRIRIATASAGPTVDNANLDAISVWVEGGNRSAAIAEACAAPVFRLGADEPASALFCSQISPSNSGSSVFCRFPGLAAHLHRLLPNP